MPATQQAQDTESKGGERKRVGSKAPRRLIKYGIACSLGILIALVATGPTAEAIANRIYYYCSYDGNLKISTRQTDEFWYAWMYTSGSSGSTQITRGVKGNLTTRGGPFTYDSQYNGMLQHVNGYVASFERDGKWTQIGWITGLFGGCGQVTTTGEDVIDFYVEIYDDTTNSCYAQLLGAAPGDASYETSYYSLTPTGMH